MSEQRRDPDFDWLDDDSVCLEPRRALAVYVNQRAEVVLRMQREWDEDDDSFVYFPFNDAEMIAARILDLVKSPAILHNAPRRCSLSEGGQQATTDLFSADGGKA